MLRKTIYKNPGLRIWLAERWYTTLQCHWDFPLFSFYVSDRFSFPVCISGRVFVDSYRRLHITPVEMIVYMSQLFVQNLRINGEWNSVIQRCM